jgi:AFG3 family protein
MCFILFFLPSYSSTFSEDMISLLGKRPFKGKSDDMDKWLDDNQGLRERSAPPPFEETPGPTEDAPTPAPIAAATKIEDLNHL